MEIRNIILHFAAVLSALTQAALFGIVITIAVVELPIERLRPFVLASSTLNGLLLLALLIILARILGDLRTTSFGHWFCSLSFTLSTTALALSFYVLASVWSIYKFKSSDLNTSVTACLVVTGIVLCSLTLITQFITHLLLLFPGQEDTDERSPTPSPKRLSATLKSLTSPLTPSRTQPAPYTRLSTRYTVSSRRGKAR
ncbi:hypothetical protein AMS68_007821 [Peltaster fructicola]|uniref:Uncharacterized protein n=1 Tax=Peltaster fructicola TaxID=286661 RepID=A0A6H0Y5L2_9PEZI|nr:hypothetical protein AMS68_007821 [Peltaster fructicola]